MMSRNNTHKRKYNPWLIGSMLAAAAPLAYGQEKVNYNDHVLPLFRNECLNCHSADKKKGDLDLSTFSGLMAGSSSGSIVTPGDSDGSKIYLSITHKEEPVMPPKKKLTDAEIALVKKWIDGGLLEDSGSKALMPAKPKVKLALENPGAGKPEGPPPMVGVMPLETRHFTARPNAITALEHSPWAPLLAIGGQKQIVLYDTSTMQLAGVIPYAEGFPEILRFSRNGKLLMAAGGLGAKQGAVVLFDVATGDRITRVGDELDSVLAADVSPDQSLVALGTTNKMIKVFSTETGSPAYEIKKHTDWVTSVAFSADGVLLATGDRNGGLLVWEARTGELFYDLRGHTGAITALSFRADSNVLVSASEDTTARMWNMHDGAQIRSWNAHGGGVLDARFAHDGRVVTAGRDQTVKMWGGDGNGLRTFPAMPDLALRAAFTDSDQRVIGSDYSGKVVVWNAADGAVVGELSPNPAPIASRIEGHKLKAAEAAGKVAALAKDDAAQAAIRKSAADTAAVIVAAQKKLEECKAAMPQQKAKADEAHQLMLQAETMAKAEMDKYAPMKAECDRLTQAMQQSEATVKQAEQVSAAAAKEAADKKKVAEAAAQAAQQKPEDAALAEAATKALNEFAAADVAAKDMAAKLKSAQDAHGPAVAAAGKAKADADAQQKIAAEKQAAHEAVGKERDRLTAITNQTAAEIDAIPKAIPAMEAQAKEAAAKAQQLDALITESAACRKAIADLTASAVYTRVYDSRATLTDVKSRHEQNLGVIAATQAALKKAQDDVPATQKLIAETDPKVKAKAAEVEPVKQTLAQLKPQLDAASAALPPKQERLAAVQKVEALLADFVAKTAVMQQAVAASDAKAAELAAAQKAHDTKAAEVAAAKAGVDKLAGDVNTAKAAVDAKTVELQNAEAEAAKDPNNAENAAKVAALRNDVQTLTNTFTQAQANHKQATDTHAKLEGERAALLPPIEKYKAEHAPLAQAAEKAKADLKAVIDAAPALVEQYNKLAAAAADPKPPAIVPTDLAASVPPAAQKCKEEIAAAEALVADYKKKVETTTAQLTALEAEFAKLNGELAAAAKKLETAKADAPRLTKQLADAQAAAEQSAQQIAAAQATHDKLTAEYEAAKPK